MLGNSFGRLFRITACGESYGDALMVIVDGVPAGLELADDDIQKELDRRRPGQSEFDSPRKETDQGKIVAGVMDGITTGAPVGIVIYNVDRHQVHVDQYRQAKDLVRPGHAEYTYSVKYGRFRDWRGAGRASGRETAGRVAGGAVAKKILAREGIELVAYVKELAGIAAKPMPFEEIKKSLAERPNPLNCPDPAAEARMEKKLLAIKEAGDTAGGVIELILRGVPAGLGEPVFDKLSSRLAEGIMSIPSVKGVEIGDGFALARMTGSGANDVPYIDGGKVRFRTNHSGGIDGGISNGEDIVLRVAVKPTSTISIEQKTVNMARMEEATLAAITRRDPTICGRISPVIEAMAAISIVDMLMMARGLDDVARMEKPWGKP